jgi:hypothetical protein
MRKVKTAVVIVGAVLTIILSISDITPWSDWKDGEISGTIVIRPHSSCQ